MNIQPISLLMKKRIDDLIHRMVEETFQEVEDSQAQLSFDFSNLTWIYDKIKKCYRFQSELTTYEVPQNFGPLADITEGMATKIFVGEDHPFYDAMCVILNNYSTEFILKKSAEGVSIHFVTEVQVKAA